MLTQLITKLFTGEAGIFIARMRVVALIYAVMVVVGMAMLGFLLAALFIWLASIYGTFATALGFAAFCLVAIVILYILLIFARRPPKQRASDRLQRDVASIASIAAISNLPMLIRSFGRDKRLILVPIAAAGIYGATRVILGFRRR